jgi:signal transduction histidine kinase
MTRQISHTQRRSREDEPSGLSRQAPAKRSALAKLSHEFRSPLNAIIGFAQLLHDGAVAPGSREYREFLADILNGGQLLLARVGEVFDSERPAPEFATLQAEAVSLAPLLAAACTRFAALAAVRGIHVEATSPGADLPDVVGARTVLRELLDRCFHIALHLTHDAGYLRVRLIQEAGSGFELEFGLDARVALKLSERFGRMSEADLPADDHLATALDLHGIVLLARSVGASLGLRSAMGCAVLRASFRNAGAVVGRDGREIQGGIGDDRTNHSVGI